MEKKEEYKKEEFEVSEPTRLNFICENCGEYNELEVEVILKSENFNKGGI